MIWKDVIQDRFARDLQAMIECHTFSIQKLFPTHVIRAGNDSLVYIVLKSMFRTQRRRYKSKFVEKRNIYLRYLFFLLNIEKYCVKFNLVRAEVMRCPFPLNFWLNWGILIPDSVYASLFRFKNRISDDILNYQVRK